MSSLNIPQFKEIPLEERIPESSRLVANKIAVQSVITDRRSVRYIPVNGGTFNASQNPTFKLQSNSSFLVPSSATLRFTLANTSKTSGGANSTDAKIDDPPAIAPFSRAIFRASGIMVEDILNVNRSVASQVYSHMSPEVYKNKSSIDLASWKWRSGGVAPLGDKSDVSSGYDSTELDAINEQLSALRHDEVGVEARAGLGASPVGGESVEINLPLSYILGSFRTNRLMPLSFFGEATLELTLANAVETILTTTASDVVNYQVQNLELFCDVVDLQDEYLRVLSSAFASDNMDMAYHLPIQTTTCITQNKPINTATATENTYVYSKSTPFLKSILFTTQSNTAKSSNLLYSTSGMPNYLSNTDANVRLFVGSKPFPEFGSLDTPEAVFRQNYIGQGCQGNVRDQFGLASAETFKTRTTKGGINYILFSFEKVNGIGNEQYYEMDSYNASLGGSVIALQMNQIGADEAALTPTSCSTLAIIEHTRVMKLGGGRVEVLA